VSGISNVDAPLDVKAAYEQGWVEDATQQADPDSQRFIDEDEGLEQDPDLSGVDPPAEVEPVVDPEPLVEPVEASVVPDDLQGKTPEELAKIVQDQRSFTGKQASELGDLRKQSQEQAAQLEQMVQYLNQMQSEQAAGYFDENGLDDPAATYNQMMEMVSQGRLPITEVETFVDRVHDVDPTLGRRMDRDFSTRLVRAETMQQLQPVQQYGYQQMLEQTTSDLYADPVLGADVKEFEQDIIKTLSGRGTLGNNPQEIRSHLLAALNAARGSDPTRSNAYRTALADRRAEGTVEGGSAPDNTHISAEQAVHNRVFEHRKADPGDFFFQPLANFKQG